MKEIKAFYLLGKLKTVKNKKTREEILKKLEKELLKILKVF